MNGIVIGVVLIPMQLQGVRNIVPLLWKNITKKLDGMKYKSRWKDESLKDLENLPEPEVTASKIDENLESALEHKQYL